MSKYQRRRKQDTVPNSRVVHEIPPLIPLTALCLGLALFNPRPSTIEYMLLPHVIQLHGKVLKIPACFTPAALADFLFPTTCSTGAGIV